MPTPRKAPKIQRWIDLLAALLGRQRAITFEEIAREVPAYARGSRDAVKRMFERDKKELRALGVPIESESADGEQDFRYRLRTADFYLPYLTVASPRGRQRPPRVDRFGYHSLRSLAFDADELLAVAAGAARARQLGNAPLAEDVASAIRKLAHDLPVGAVSAPDHTTIVAPNARADGRVLETLADALHARKRVRFEYRSQERDATTTRVVEPYGLFFLNAHWYLVARDVDRDAMRNFRVSRISDVAQRSPTKELPEYEIPPTFRLREHARSRQAWELGDADVIETVVEFRGRSGATLAGASLGTPVPGVPDRRVFLVRRPDAFVRWLLSFAGEAMPVAPDAIVEEFRRQLAATLAVYDGDAAARGSEAR